MQFLPEPSGGSNLPTAYLLGGVLATVDAVTAIPLQESALAAVLPHSSHPESPSATIEAVPAIPLQEQDLAAQEEGLERANQRPIIPAFIPRFVIPADKPQTLREAECTHGRSFWSHQLYQDANGGKVKVTYCATLQASEACAKRFLDATVLGFDMEWDSRYNYGPGIKNNASLIQLASETEIGLFHIGQHRGESVDELVAPSLKEVLESVSITKTGVNILCDSSRLKKHLEMQPRGLFELSHLHKLVTYGASEPHKINRVPVSLEEQVNEHLSLSLDKAGGVRCSKWSGWLTEKQRSYAGSDAYAGYQLFHVLNAKRLKMDPVSLLPAFAELKLPIAVVLSPEQCAKAEAEGGMLSSSLATNGRRAYAQRKSRMPVGTTEDKLDSELVCRLRSCWDDLSTKYEKDPKLNLSRQALMNIASLRPSTLGELGRIWGVNKHRVRTYGAEILAAVNGSVKAVLELGGDQIQATEASPIATQDPPPADPT